MKITALVENTTRTTLSVEHGLSLYIETKKHRILFDSGQSTLFLENAKKLGVDLSTVDICVLSHGHYDHGGGLKAFTQVNDRASIYMSRYAFGRHHHGADRYIGLNRDWIDDADFQKRVIYTDGDLTIDDELSILMPRSEKVIDMGSAGLDFYDGDKLVPEDFRHEHYLMITEDGRRVLISGCSHQGIINICEWYKPDVLVGGFHFMKEELGERLAGFGKTLNNYNIDYYTCHCTGVAQYEFLKPYIARMSYLAEGDTVDI
ncbi:MAG: MBL fold metallo-hydrolase [Lachnospiraceae bacterium]|nr:MBL fold metallo-hydrolase [Lachnospiraceae bacterium]